MPKSTRGAGRTTEQYESSSKSVRLFRRDGLLASILRTVHLTKYYFAQPYRPALRYNRRSLQRSIRFQFNILVTLQHVKCENEHVCSLISRLKITRDNAKCEQRRDTSLPSTLLDLPRFYIYRLPTSSISSKIQQHRFADNFAVQHSR